MSRHRNGSQVLVKKLGKTPMYPSNTPSSILSQRFTTKHINNPMKNSSTMLGPLKT
jgi:hypothetical protein